MIDMHASLRAHGVPTCIFANTNGIAVGHIRKKFPFFANFDNYVYSFEHRSMKPDAKIYSIVEKVTGHSGDKIVYIDDRAENVEGGAKRGWRTIFHETPEKTIPLLRAMGLPVDG